MFNFFTNRQTLFKNPKVFKVVYTSYLVRAARYKLGHYKFVLLYELFLVTIITVLGYEFFYKAVNFIGSFKIM